MRELGLVQSESVDEEEEEGEEDDEEEEHKEEGVWALAVMYVCMYVC